MKIHRFYLKQNISSGNPILVEDEGLVHQLVHVFRMETGDIISLFNEADGDWECQISEISKKQVRVSPIKQVIQGFSGNVEGEDAEKGVEIWGVRLGGVFIAPALIKQDNFELVLQKATEIGVGGIYPIIAERSQYKKLNNERAEKILIEATEQSGRIDIPKLHELGNLKDFCESNDQKLFFVVLDQNGEKLNNVSDEYKKENSQENSSQNICVLVGPEGGWSEDELEFFKQKKYARLKLGEHILRAETASILGAFAVQQFLQ